MLGLYETFYKLTADPFRLSPDHRFALDHHSYAKSKSYLEYALHRGEGFIVITGGAGTGKTTLINEILARLDKTHIQVASLTSTQLGSRDLLHMVAASFGLPLKEMDKAALLLGLEAFLKQEGQKGRRAVLIVDEAQDLSHAALEELRLLANLQFNNRLLLQVFLVGQEPLQELIATPGMEHLRQRIVAASHLEPLKPNETVDYLEHRLSRVGWKGDPKIDAEALMLVHRFSGGIPRTINLICSRLFLYGAMEKKHALVGADAKNVIEDLQQEHFVMPVAERVNGTTGSLSRIGVTAEELTIASVHGLPREKKTSEDNASTSQHPSADPRSEKTATDSTQQINVRTGEPEHQEVEGGGSRSELPSFSGKDMWAKSRGSNRNSGTVMRVVEALDDVTVQTAEKSAADRVKTARIVTPAFGEPAETDNPPVVPLRLDSIMTAEPRRTQQARTDKGKRRSKGRITAVIFALLVMGFVLVVVVGVDTIDRTVETVSEKIMGKQKGTTQREVPYAEPEHSQIEVEDGRTEPSLSGPEKPLTASLAVTHETETETEPPRPGNEVDLPTAPPVSGPTTDTPTTEVPGSPLTAGSEESTPIPDASAEELLTPERVAPPQAPPAPVPTVADTVGEGAGEEGSLSSIDAQLAHLRVAAEKGLNQHLSGRPPAVEKTAQVMPPLGGQAPVSVRPEVLVPSKPPKKVQSSRPRFPVQKTRPAPTVIVTAPRSKPRSSTSSPDQIKSALMAGRWSSRGKPAALLPSDITRCQQKGARVACWSVPQNIDTKYGLAIYKVEVTLQDFSAAGEFRVSYRTLVRLVKDDTSEGVEKTAAAGSGRDRWQVSEHSMTCQLSRLSRILCHDDKGTKREYLRL